MIPTEYMGELVSGMPVGSSSRGISQSWTKGHNLAGWTDHSHLRYVDGALLGCKKSRVSNRDEWEM